MKKLNTILWAVIFLLLAWTADAQLPPYARNSWTTNNLFSQVLITTAPTNLIIDCSGPVYRKMLCTDNVNVQWATNGPGAISLKFWPNGADRTLTFPTNWVFLNTNGLTLSGTFWSVVLSNTPAGNGARAGILAISLDDATCRQTNVFAKFVLSP